MRRGVVGAVLFVAFGAGLLGAKGQKTRDACGDADWACVAECIDVKCIMSCYPPTCLRTLAALRKCAQREGCPPDDAACTEQNCEGLCDAAFGAPPDKNAPKFQDPCAGGGGTGAGVPGKLVGDWELIAATMQSVDAGEELEPTPRPDYTRRLRISPSGCFVLETPLSDPTLGNGNDVLVRASGQVRVQGKNRLTLETRAAHAEGNICMRPVTKALASTKFRMPQFKFVVEGGILSLIAADAEHQAFQFERRKAE